MNIYALLGIVSGMGALGGLVNCALEGEFSLPHLDAEFKVWRPGWIGNVLCGAVAAAVVWGLYGPLSGLELTGLLEARLTVSQAFTSLVVGLSGGRILLSETQKLMLRRERDDETFAKNALATAAKKLKAAKRPKKP